MPSAFYAGFVLDFRTWLIRLHACPYTLSLPQTENNVSTQHAGDAGAQIKS